MERGAVQGTLFLSGALMATVWPTPRRRLRNEVFCSGPDSGCAVPTGACCAPGTAHPYRSTVSGRYAWCGARPNAYRASGAVRRKGVPVGVRTGCVLGAMASSGRSVTCGFCRPVRVSVRAFSPLAQRVPVAGPQRARPVMRLVENPHPVLRDGPDLLTPIPYLQVSACGGPSGRSCPCQPAKFRVTVRPDTR